MPSFDPYGPPWSPKVEDLAKAQESLQNLEMQIETLGQLDEGPAAEYLRPLINGMYLPMLQTQLDSAREYRDRIQKRMEDQAQTEEAGS